MSLINIKRGFKTVCSCFKEEEIEKTIDTLKKLEEEYSGVRYSKFKVNYEKKEIKIRLKEEIRLGRDYSIPLFKLLIVELHNFSIV